MQVKIIKCHHVKEFLFWYDSAISTRKHCSLSGDNLYNHDIHANFSLYPEDRIYTYMYATYMYMYIHTELTENRQNICLFNNAYDMS